MTEVIKTDKSGEQIRVEVNEYKGRSYMNVRRWFKSDEGDWLPTKKGITFEVSMAREVIQAMLSELESQ